MIRRAPPLCARSKLFSECTHFEQSVQLAKKEYVFRFSV